MILVLLAKMLGQFSIRCFHFLSAFPHLAIRAHAVQRFHHIFSIEHGKPMFVVLGLRCLLDCHVLKGFGIYMIGILDRLY